MSGKRSRKRKVVKLAEDEDLHESFGEQSPQSVSFVDEFEQAVTDADLEKAANEKGTKSGRRSSFNELLLSYPPPQTELDLHGMTSKSAERKVRTVLWQSAADKIKTVRIITGKGLHSDGPAVLPDVTETVLKEMKASGNILHYQWERKVKHKSGAVIVYLK